MTSTFEHIRARLRVLEDALFRSIAVEAALVTLAGLSLALSVALGMAQLGWPQIATWMLLFATVLLFAGAGWVLLQVRRQSQVHYAREAADLAQQLAPEMHGAPRIAIDLAERMSLGDASFSSELAQAHLQRTSETLSSIDLSERLRAARTLRRHRAWAALAAGVGLVLSSAWALDEGRDRLLTSLLDPGSARMSPVPLVGDLRLTYRYPAYTGRSPRVVQGGDGSISAVVGTEVTLEGVADSPSQAAFLVISGADGSDRREIALTVTDGRELQGRLSVLRDAKYRFALVNPGGDRVEEQGAHIIRALLDAYPEAHLDEPKGDIELREGETVDVLWRARDDFGVGEVNLVVEPGGGKEPIKIPLAAPNEAEARREGRYRWSALELPLKPGTEGRFYVEAYDNDAINGPKRATSATRRLTLFSARRNHEKLLTRQKAFLDALVDLLASELTQPVVDDATTAVTATVRTQQQVVNQMNDVVTLASTLVDDLRNDDLTQPEIVVAFENVRDHLQDGLRKRTRSVFALKQQPGLSRLRQLARQQTQGTRQAEKDVIYLDDLLALQRIDELKDTAQDLLASQRQLQDLLDTYRETQDPGLRRELEQRIRSLREEMLALMSKMASIKQTLPGEYRNLEAAAMLQLDDQLGRLEKLLQQGDLEAAARELEELANMLENMVDTIKNAEEEYGGERYAEMRQQLAEFAQEFERLEEQQQALAQRSEDLLKQYRKRALQQTGKNAERFVREARKKTAQALEALDDVGSMPGLYGQSQKELSAARQRLMDLDTLLEHQDFAEARAVGAEAEARERNLDDELDGMIRRLGFRRTPELSQSMQATQRALDRTQEVNNMLDQLFPDPSEVLTPQQAAQMRRMAQRQQALEAQAQQLEQRMESMSAELPLFGGEPRQSLEAARQEMAGASRRMGQGDLPGATGGKRRAAGHLKKLREGLEQASQSGGQGLPLPLGLGSRNRGGGGRGSMQDDVEIPPSDSRAGPQFRQELLEAAKQKAPERYEEAVRRYYEELIR